MNAASHRFVIPRDEPTIPEWKMSTAEWIAHQERLHGQDWRAAIERMDGEAADAAFYGCVGSEAWDAAADLSAHRCATVGMVGEGSAPHALPGVVK